MFGPQRVSILAAAVFTVAACRGPGVEPLSQEERVAGIVQSSRWSELHLELDVVDGLGPRQEVLDRVLDDLDTLVDKPDGISLVRDEELEPHGGNWTESQLRSFADEHFDDPYTDEFIGIHVMWLDGAFADAPEETLAVAWENRHVAVFGEVIESACTDDDLVGKGLIERVCSETERVAWTHELGHILGLVNQGVPMVTDHEDPDHAHHDVNSDCLMFHTYGSGSNVFQRVRGDVQQEDEETDLFFDQACLDDLEALREG